MPIASLADVEATVVLNRSTVDMGMVIEDE